MWDACDLNRIDSERRWTTTVLNDRWCQFCQRKPRTSISSLNTDTLFITLKANKVILQRHKRWISWKQQRQENKFLSFTFLKILKPKISKVQNLGRLGFYF